MDEQVLFREPVQASMLLGQLRQRQVDLPSGLEHRKLMTGLADVDDYLLQGGIQRGCVVGISSGGASAANGSGRRRNPNAQETPEGLGAGRLIILHALVRALLDHPFSQASIIDSTGSFPLALLARVVRWQIARENQRKQRSGTEGSNQLRDNREESLDSKVISILERVSITRVFDIEGLWEVLGEVCHGAEHHDSTAKANYGINTPVEESKSSHKASTDVPGRSASGKQEDELARPALSPEIMDSEDEDDDLDTDNGSIQSTGSPKLESDMNKESNATSDSPPFPKAAGKSMPTEIVMVDNMATLINDLFGRTERGAAHTLLMQLAHTLTSLTHSSNLTVFLLNTLTPRSSRKISVTQDRHSSAFAAMTSTPSLGMIFDSFTDLHLMCHSLPATAGDADMAYGGADRQDENDGAIGDWRDSRHEMGQYGNNERTVEGDGGEVLFANVIEVLKDDCPDLDRWEGVDGDDKPRKATSREQRWVAFRIADGVGLANANFDSNGKV